MNADYADFFKQSIRVNGRKSAALKFLRSVYLAENLNTVFWWNVSPGLRMVLGNLG